MYVSVSLIKKLEQVEPSLREVLIAVLEEIERQREETVTKREFNELKEIVRELAQAQKRTEERVEELAQAQKRTEERVEELAQAQKRTEERLEELAQAQKRTEERVEELAEAQKRTEERLDSLAQKVEELAMAQRKTEERVDRLAQGLEQLSAEMRNLARQVGALSDSIGFGIEDIAHVVLPGYLYRHLGVEMGEFERRFLQVDGEDVEINLYAEGSVQGEKVTILGEVKSRIYAREVEAFQATLSKVMPLIRGKVLKVMFGYFFRPEASELAKKYGIIPVVSYQR